MLFSKFKKIHRLKMLVKTSWKYAKSCNNHLLESIEGIQLENIPSNVFGGGKPSQIFLISSLQFSTDHLIRISHGPSPSDTDELKTDDHAHIVTR